MHDDVVVTFGDTFLSEREILRLASLAQYDNNGELYCYGRQNMQNTLQRRGKSNKIFFILQSRFSGRPVLNRLEGKKKGISRGKR